MDFTEFNISAEISSIIQKTEETDDLSKDLYHHLLNITETDLTYMNKINILYTLHQILNLLCKLGKDDESIKIFNNKIVQLLPNYKKTNIILNDILLAYEQINEIKSEDNTTKFNCNKCNETIIDCDNNSLIHHIITCKSDENHKKFMLEVVNNYLNSNKNTGYNGFYCEYCNIYNFNENNKITHNLNCKGIIEKKYSELKWYFCDTCHIDLCGSNNILREHNDMEYHKLLKSNKNIKCVNNKANNNLQDLKTDVELNMPSSSSSEVNKYINNSDKLSGMETKQDNIDENYLKDIMKTFIQRNKELQINNVNYKQFMLNILKKTIKNPKNEYNGYYCDICNFWSTEKIDSHENSLEHIQNYTSYILKITNNNDNNKKQILQKIKIKDILKIEKYFCVSCKLYIIGNYYVYNIHLETDEHLSLKYLTKDNEKTMSCEELDLHHTEENNFNDNNNIKAENINFDELIKKIDKKNNDKIDNVNDKLKNNDKIDNVHDELKHNDKIDNVNDELKNNDEVDKVNDELKLNYNNENDNEIKEYYESDSSEDDDALDRYLKSKLSINNDNKSSNIFKNTRTQSQESINSNPRTSNNRNKIRQHKNLIDIKQFQRTVLLVSGYPLTTTRNDVFRAFKDYGHIENLTMERNNTATVTYKMKKVTDLILENRIPIIINGEKVRIEKQIISKNIPIYAKVAIPEVITQTFHSLEHFNKMLSDVLLEATKEELDFYKSDGKIVIKTQLQQLFQKDIKIIGSRATGLAFSEDNVDIYFDFGNNYFGKKDQNAVALSEIAGELKYILKMKENFNDVNTAYNKEIPVIRANYKFKGPCNIFFLNGLMDIQTQLISIYLKIDQRVKEIILIIKKWMMKNNLIGPDKLSGYAVTWMVLFYLMRGKYPVVPPVIVLRTKQTADDKFIAGWDCRFTNDISFVKKTNKEKTAYLVYGFFKHYSYENNPKSVHCPLTGELIRKKKIAELDLPPPYRSYKFNLLRNTITEKFPLTDGLCLQDPIQLNCNLTNILQGKELSNFVFLCKETTKLCKPWNEKNNHGKHTGTHNKLPQL